MEHSVKLNNNKLIIDEMKDIYSRLQQSDTILCNNIENLQFSHKRENDLRYMYNLSRTMPNKIKNVAEEYQMWTQSFRTRVADCTDTILNRGGNVVVKPFTNCAGYECFQPCYTKELTYVPCKNNTFKNHLVKDDEKVCTSNHQLFNNVTKRC
jgi:hypothetical protein